MYFQSILILLHAFNHFSNRQYLVVFILFALKTLRKEVLHSSVKVKPYAQIP